MSSGLVWTKNLTGGPRDGEVHITPGLMPELWFHNFGGGAPDNFVYELAGSDRETLTALYRWVEQ